MGLRVTQSHSESLSVQEAINNGLVLPLNFTDIHSTLKTLIQEQEIIMAVLNQYGMEYWNYLT